MVMLGDRPRPGGEAAPAGGDAPVEEDEFPF
jgi:hypothetical protein